VSDVTPRPSDSFIVITAKDGTAVRCQLLSFPLSPGSEALTEQRWVFSTKDGRQHIGPPSATIESREALELVVDSWWTSRQTTQQKGRSQDRQS
jgi:hypothetical protein